MPIIGFEARLDGAGKSTTARAVARRYAGIVATDIELEPFWREERQAVNNGPDVERRFAYFLDLNRHHMRLAKAVGGMTRQLVVLDTTVYRTVATHRVLGSVDAKNYDIGRLVTPDITFLLKVEEEERVRRLIKRDGQLVHPSHWDELLYERRDDLAEIYDSFNLPVIDVNGSIEDAVHGAVNQAAEMLPYWPESS